MKPEIFLLDFWLIYSAYTPLSTFSCLNSSREIQQVLHKYLGTDVQ